MTLVISSYKVLWTALIFALVFNSSTSSKGGEEAGKRRRQVFREDVSPLLGGKVPSGAFDWARLMFNNLDSRGISVPDGFILSNDRQQVRNQEKRIKLYSKDGKEIIDSTYTVRNPVANSVKSFRNEGRYNNRDQNYVGSRFFPSPTDEFAWEMEPPMNHWSSTPEADEFEDCQDNGLRYAPDHAETDYPLQNQPLDEKRYPQQFWTHEDWIRNQVNFRRGNVRPPFHESGNGNNHILQDRPSGIHRNRIRNRHNANHDDPITKNKIPAEEIVSHQSNKPTNFKETNEHSQYDPDDSIGKPNSVVETPEHTFQDTKINIDSDGSGENSNGHTSEDSFNETSYNSEEEFPRSNYPFNRNHDRNKFDSPDVNHRRPSLHDSQNHNYENLEEEFIRHPLMDSTTENSRNHLFTKTINQNFKIGNPFHVHENNNQNSNYNSAEENSAHPFRENSGEENWTVRPNGYENSENSVEENSSAENAKLKLYQNSSGGNQIEENVKQNQVNRDRNEIRNSNKNLHSEIGYQNSDNSAAENSSGEEVKHKFQNPTGASSGHRQEIAENVKQNQGNRKRNGIRNSNQNFHSESGYQNSDNSAAENLSGEEVKHKFQNPARASSGHRQEIAENVKQNQGNKGRFDSTNQNFDFENGYHSNDNSAEENFSGESLKHKYQIPTGENSGHQIPEIINENRDRNPENFNPNQNSHLNEAENSERFGSLSKVPGKFGESGSSSASGNDEENDAINPKPFMLINGNSMGIQRNRSSSISGSNSHGDNQENNFMEDQYRDKLIDDIITRMQITTTVAPPFIGHAPGPPPPPPPGLPDSILKVTLFSHPSPPGSIIESINGPPGFLKNKKRKEKFKSILQKLFEPFRP